MTAQDVRSWGRYLEDELTSVEVVITYALSHGSIDAPTAWVRSRSAPCALFQSRESVNAYIDDVWFPEHVFFLRQLPALRFDTVHGSVVVTDAWGDSGYESLRGAAGRRALRLGAPLLALATRIDGLDVQAIGWQGTEPVVPRRKLAAWSSYAVWQPDADGGPYCEWAREPHDPDRSGARAVMKAFLAVNSPQELQAGRDLMLAARQRSEGRGGVDVEGGLAHLEAWANGIG